MLFVDVLHLIRVKRLEQRVLALGAEQYSDTILSIWVDPNGNTLDAVHKDFDDATVDEDA